MNNNNLNDQNNFNSQYNGINNQPVNNSMNNNVSNNFNNINNNKNNLSSNRLTKKAKNNKLFAIIIGIIVIIIVVVIVLKGFNSSSVLGSNKNTTGSTEYNSSDVDNNCTYEYSTEDKNMKIYSDFIFNYKTTESNGSQNNYQLKIYSTMVVEYENGLTDSKYKDFVDTFDSLVCLNSDECTGNHLELGVTNTGWDTVIDRIGNKIEVT